MKRKLVMLLSVAVIMTMAFAFTACGSSDDSQTEETKATETTEATEAEKEELKPISEADFAITANWDQDSAEDINIIEHFGKGEQVFYSFYEEGVDKSREGVMKTSRDITLGATKDDVIAKYGEPPEKGKVNLEEFPEAVYFALEDDGEDALMDQYEKEAVSYFIYNLNNFQMALYFDSDDTLTWLAFYNWEE